ncbi:MAG TPA: UDP-N-acetylglucosamine acyltransferase [Pseudonocardia sp.]|nr:UDP-N-acetylglucosamine acyltransferase [Pseudonocardia sp.]
MSVHPTAVVGGGVELGERVVVGPHAVLLGPCRIADDVLVGPGCVIGSPPELTTARQNAAWDGEEEHCGVEIGPGTVVREMCSVQQGSRAATRIGAGCWLLSRSYVAHDCAVGDAVTLSAGVALGGHVQVGDGATLGMNATVHQRRVVGPGAMVGMSAAVTRDLPPFAKAYGVPARLHGANVLGLARRGVPEPQASELDAVYRAGAAPPPLRDGPLRAAWEWWWARTSPAHG